MNKTKTLEDRVSKLMHVFGDNKDGTCPTKEQWEYILKRDIDSPITLVNLFKLNEKANYKDQTKNSVSGQQAFERYAKVSQPKVASVGGKFLLVAPFEQMFMGDNENWDLVAIGSYPNTKTLLALFEDQEYQAAFHHRTAACKEHKVFICKG